VKSKKYGVVEKEVEGFKNFFTELYKDTLEDLSLPINYFNKSYIEPQTPRDAFIDLIIALENLYLKGEQLELGYKLRLRMSYLLGKRFEQKKEVFEDMKKAYDFRGRIIHGGVRQDVSYEFFLKIRDYTRESLKLFVKNPDLRKQGRLDEIILKGVE